MLPKVAEKLKKITARTIPVYLLVLLLMVTARPQPRLFMLGLLFILMGEGLRIWATGHLQKNQEVTTTGPYAYVKNPLYLGTFLIIIGFCVMANQFLLLSVGICLFLFYYVPRKKRTEASRLADRFGQAWIDYDEQVPDYLPRWTPYRSRGRRRWNIRQLLKNSEHETFFAVLVGVMVIGLNLFLIRS